jgi:hypothetical protein
MLLQAPVEEGADGRAGLKPGAYNSEARNAGKMPAVQNRNAPAEPGHSTQQRYCTMRVMRVKSKN